MESDTIRQNETHSLNTVLKYINGVSIQVVKKKILKYMLLH